MRKEEAIKKYQIDRSVLIYIFLPILVILPLLYLEKKDSVISELNRALSPSQSIIDYAIQEDKAFAIISSEGRSDYGDLLAVFQKGEGTNWTSIYENDFKDLKPWKIELGDIDGDCTTEVITGVYKTTHFDQSPKNRLFIFNFDNGILSKKWTGSEIAGTWRDFTVGELLPTQGEELLFIEQIEGKERMVVYYWFDFGFSLMAKSDMYQGIKEFSIQDDNRIKIRYQDRQKRSTVLRIKDGKLKEVS